VVTTALPPQPILVEDENEAGSNDRKGIEHAGCAAAGTETQHTQYMVMTAAARPVTETAQEGQSHVRKTKKKRGAPEHFTREYQQHARAGSPVSRVRAMGRRAQRSQLSDTAWTRSLNDGRSGSSPIRPGPSG